MVSRTYVRNTGPVSVYDLGFGWSIGDALDTFSNYVTPQSEERASPLSTGTR
jgi:hypothetical protein